MTAHESSPHKEKSPYPWSVNMAGGIMTGRKKTLQVGTRVGGREREMKEAGR